jgi:hypothetical protein
MMRMREAGVLGLGEMKRMRAGCGGNGEVEVWRPRIEANVYGR